MLYGYLGIVGKLYYILFHLQYCVTAMVYDPEGKFKFINKGCRSLDWCESNEVRDKSCCTTPLCNTGGLPGKWKPIIETRIEAKLKVLLTLD